MNCEKIEELILSMPDGELTQEERETLAAHVAVCPHCREMYDAVLALSDELKAEPELPPALHDEIMSAVRRETRAKKPTAVRLRRYLAAAACFAVVVAAAGAGAVISGMFRCGSAAPQSSFSTAENAAPDKAAPDDRLFMTGGQCDIMGESASDAVTAPAESQLDGVQTVEPPTPKLDAAPDIAEASLKSVTADGETETHLTAAEAQVFLTALFDGGLNENDAGYDLHITESGGSEYTLYLTLADGVIAMSLTPDDPEPHPVASVSELAELINELK